MDTLLQVEHLCVNFDTPAGSVQAVRDVSLCLRRGETLAIVGESGCGKSVLCRAIMQLLPHNARISGKVLLDGTDITPLTEKDMCKLRGTRFAMLFQDPMTSLNPTIPVGRQIEEAVLRHRKISRKAAQELAAHTLHLVGIEDPVQRMTLQPHYFSGGMRQRCVLAIALALNPDILFADEPTTSLDVTVQAQILDLLRDIQRRTQLGTVLVSHDLGVVARVADRVAVMYAGKIVEIGTAENIFYEARHPYTWALLEALPSRASVGGTLRAIPGMPPNLLDPPPGDAFAERNRFALKIDYEHMPPLFKISETHSAATWLLDKRAPPVVSPLTPLTFSPKVAPVTAAALPPSLPDQPPLLSIRHYAQKFRMSSNLTIHAVNDVSFDVYPGEIFGLVGESGCGKSTLARAIMGLHTPSAGEILFKGIPLSEKRAYREQRERIQRGMQVIFQDSAAALNPRMTVAESVAEALIIQKLYPKKQQLPAEVDKLLHLVGLDVSLRDKLPAELSGGQRQRVAIARCIGVNPELIVADEAVASLDISIQAQIISLFQHLQQGHGFAFLFIAHDLTLVRFLCNRVGVMYRGKLVEVGPTAAVFGNPQHPYTQALLAAMPVPDPKHERSRADKRLPE